MKISFNLPNKNCELLGPNLTELIASVGGLSNWYSDIFFNNFDLKFKIR